MKAIGLDRFGAPEVLRMVERSTPSPGDGEVRIRVSAAAVNPTDLTFRSGGRATMLADVPPPWVPGMDLAGIVDGLGPLTDGRLAIGDPVIAYVMPFTIHGGAYAEQVVVPEASVVPAPAGLAPTSAATVLLNALTARLALDALALGPGEPLLITGAAGAVGGYAVELARADGLSVIGQGRAEDEAAVRALGAESWVDPERPLAAAVREVTGGPVGAVIDAANLREAALGALADGGAIASLKGWTGPAERDIAVLAISSFASAQDTATLTRLAELAAAGGLTPRVAEVLPARAAADAHRRLETGGVRGRLVLDLGTPA